MAVKVSRYDLIANTKTLIASGQGCVVVNCSNGLPIGVGSGEPLPLGWSVDTMDGVVIPITNLSEHSNPVTFHMRQGDKLYAWPVSAGNPVVKVVEAD